MKLLLCRNCWDVVKLQKETRSCKCGESGGRYTDNLNAEYWGADETYIIGLDNRSLIRAIQNEGFPDPYGVYSGRNNINAWVVIEDHAGTCHRIPLPPRSPDG